MANGVKLTVLEGPTGPLVVKEAIDEAGRTSLGAERDRLARAAHPGVVEVVEADPHHITLAWAGSDTVERLRPTVPEAAALLAAVASTVADLHQIGLVHGRLDPTHVLVGADGRPRLCGLRGPEPGAPPAREADDVAALGGLIDHLMGPGVEAEPIPERRWGVRRWSGHQRRALLAVADHALHGDPDRRPSARALAASIALAVPEARIGAAPQPAEARPTTDRPPAPLAGGRRRRLLAASGLGALAVLGVAGLAERDRGAPTVPTAAWSAGDDPEPGRAEPATDPVAEARPGPDDRPPVPGRAECPRPDPTASRDGRDVDGDGCPDRVEVRGRSIVADGTGYEIGEVGDRVAVADWDCDGVATPAIVRPATGEVFVFDDWAAPGVPVTIEATTVVEGAQRLRAPRPTGRCAPVVVLDDRTTRPLRSGGGEP